ncbi:MAG: hypothetical protein LBV75_05715 [Paludibacter sp.]|jgi:TPR repeat protein|nr:hypothetical protein [Paludibacter sp.]
MKQTLYFGCLIVFIALFSCKQKPAYVIAVSGSTRPIEELKNLVLEKGDTVAYDELCTAFMREKREYENLTYSLLMANKYNYPPAYCAVFDYLIIASELYGNSIDEKTKAMALEYLMKAAELNNMSAFSRLGGLYKEGKIVCKDSIKSEYYFQKCWK